MIVPIDIARKYAETLPYLDIVTRRVRDIVWAYCENHGYAFASRSKTIESIAEKIETGRFRKWSDLEDLYACTIVIPTLGQERQALSFLEDRFIKEVVRSRGTTQKNPEVFRFDSTRFIGRLKPERTGVSDPLRAIQFEVQIRTAFEHAWCVTTHNLAYKGQAIDWRRLRLVAQLKAAVEQMDNLILGFEEAAKYISAQHWHEVATKREIQDFFRGLFDSDRLPREVMPTNWMRFCDNLYSLLAASSEKPSRIMKQVLDALNEEVESLGPDRHPLSITLMQFVFGVLTERGLLAPPGPQEHTVLITDQLKSLYPTVERYRNPFDLEW
ncbi:MAG: hypothetical protein V2B18_04245 [Pseudomonadota bacterium]